MTRSRGDGVIPNEGAQNIYRTGLWISIKIWVSSPCTPGRLEIGSWILAVLDSWSRRTREHYVYFVSARHVNV